MTSDDKIILWGREFARVPDGLDERQVKAYVDGLLSNASAGLKIATTGSSYSMRSGASGSSIATALALS